MKVSPWARGVELAKLATKIGIKKLNAKSVKSRIEQATLIAKSLSSLKGAAMKAGQLLSLDLLDYFPPEAIEILSKLQSESVAIPTSEMKSILLHELGASRFAEIENFSERPIGVASIGQVHRASFKGHDIAIKIQYPNIAGSIDSDLKILRVLAESLGRITGRNIDLSNLFEEFRSLLKQEADYEIEAEHQIEFTRFIGEFTQSNDVLFRVPAVQTEISTEYVLAMNFEEGMSLREWIKSNPSADDRIRLGTAILDLYFFEFFEKGFVQTDPNLANFLIREKNHKIEVVLLDFGAVKKFPLKFIEDYSQILRAAASKDSALVKKLAVQLQFIDSRESDAAFTAFENLLLNAISPFSQDGESYREFDFADVEHLKKSHGASRLLFEALKYSPPPHQIIFLHRKLAGVYSILKMLGVKMDLSRYWARMSS